MPRRKKTKPKTKPKPYPSKPGERGLLLKWWKDEDAPVRREREAENRRDD
jgi:hypothetical protein